MVIMMVMVMTMVIAMAMFNYDGNGDNDADGDVFGVRWSLTRGLTATIRTCGWTTSGPTSLTLTLTHQLQPGRTNCW